MTLSGPLAWPGGEWAKEPTRAARAEPEGSYEYRVISQGPAVAADEVEDPRDLPALEVRTSWGRNLLHTAVLAPPRSFCVGEGRCDYVVPAEMIGAARVPLVVVTGGAACCILPPGAHGTLELPGQPKRTLADTIAEGIARPTRHVHGGHELTLRTWASVRMEVRGLVFEIAATAAGRRQLRACTAASLVGGLLLYVLGSGVAHGGLLGALAMFAPDTSNVADDSVSDEQRIVMRQYLDAIAEREAEERATAAVGERRAESEDGAPGARARGEEGSMGTPNAIAQGNRYAVPAARDLPEPHLARQAALRDAAGFGMVGLLDVGAGGDPNAPTAAWGRDDSSGAGPVSEQGSMWGEPSGESFGYGSLGLTGVGEGGGGRGEGIGLGTVGTLGHGGGACGCNGEGSARGTGRVGGSHRAKAPTVRVGATNVSGRLPPEVVQRIVRQSFGRFRMCYEAALRSNPRLQGRVSVSFVIGRDGRVVSASAGGDLPDASVTACVARQFYGLSFPQPDGGIVTVAYPIVFAPGP
ncbi:MAG: AgmX/PglI C-terminal domain-containing protein [Polyangiaceae bacterium]|nr:AgmX/PglI C-terminal domain-containing protein [Polyangiaceae bacterium]